MPESPELKTESISPEDKQKLLKMSEISLMLDSYDDIFSDFDPRPYSQRALSDDFLSEARRASRDKPSGKNELKFLIPTALRNAPMEATIKKRLSEHFKRHHSMERKEYKSVIHQGIVFAVTGIIVMFITTVLLFKSADQHTVIGSFFIVLLEPSGWFLFWEGLGQIFFESKKKKPEADFYGKMVKCEIKFIPY